MVIVGAGAAGLMTGIALGRALQASGQRRRVVLVDGAKKVGAKVLVAGGGRCNVTHHAVDHRAYAGSTPGAVKSVLRRWMVEDTVDFFRGLGVELKREPTGKLFPVTDKAMTVLSALLSEIARLGAVGVELRHPWRVEGVERQELENRKSERGSGGGGASVAGGVDDASSRVSSSEFRVRSTTGETISASHVVLAPGGRALPRSGSDGAGHAMARAMGHSVTDRVWPSLVPVRAGEGSAWVTELSGVSCRAGVAVCERSPSGRGGKRVAAFENDLLCTHFGLSGPAAMDASRYLELDGSAVHGDGSELANDGVPRRVLVINWLVDVTFEAADARLRALGRSTVGGVLRSRLPERLAAAVCASVGVDPATAGTSLTKDARRRLAHALTATVVEVAGDRGWHHAETTAGGVPMSEVDPKTMASRVVPGLSLVGEVLDVDGRIGGFNFQWAWATGSICGAALGGELAPFVT